MKIPAAVLNRLASECTLYLYKNQLHEDKLYDLHFQMGLIL